MVTPPQCTPRLFFKPCPDAMPIEVQALAFYQSREQVLVRALRGKPFVLASLKGLIPASLAVVHIGMLEVQYVAV